MGGEEVIKPDKWCVEQIFDALQHAEASVARISDYWFPTYVKIEVSRHFVAVGFEGMQYTIILYPRYALVSTRNCSLIVYPDEMQLHNHVAQITYKGKRIFVDQRFYFTGKELYEVHELYEKIKEMFKKVINTAALIINN